LQEGDFLPFPMVAQTPRQCFRTFFATEKVELCLQNTVSLVLLLQSRIHLVNAAFGAVAEHDRTCDLLYQKNRGEGDDSGDDDQKDKTDKGWQSSVSFFSTYPG